MAARERVRRRRQRKRSRSLRILHVTAPAPAGGLEQVVQALAVGHHRRGHTVSVINLLQLDEPSHPMAVVLAGAGVEVKEIRLPHRAYARERAAIREYCLEFRPDVVHTHGYRPDVIDRPVAERLGIPTVTTVHGASFIGGLKGAFYEWLQRRAYRRFDAVVAVSTALFDEAIADGVQADRLHLIRNAWGGLYVPMPREDARRALGLAGDATVIGWVGRLIPVKGGDVFLDAVARMPEPRPRIVMIGHGAEEQALRERARKLGVDVSFHLDVTDAGRLFPAFDTYVLSSRSEGLPVVLLEAMAAGTPIVATAVGGVPEAIDTSTGWVVPSEDPAGLADAIAQSIADRAAARERALAARRRLDENFGLDAWLDRYEGVYEAVAPAARDQPLAPRETRSRS